MDTNTADTGISLVYFPQGTFKPRMLLRKKKKEILVSDSLTACQTLSPPVYLNQGLIM